MLNRHKDLMIEFSKKSFSRCGQLFFENRSLDLDSKSRDELKYHMWCAAKIKRPTYRGSFEIQESKPFRHITENKMNLSLQKVQLLSKKIPECYIRLGGTADCHLSGVQGRSLAVYVATPRIFERFLNSGEKWGSSKLRNTFHSSFWTCAFKHNPIKWFQWKLGNFETKPAKKRQRSQKKLHVRPYPLATPM